MPSSPIILQATSKDLNPLIPYRQNLWSFSGIMACQQKRSAKTVGSLFGFAPCGAYGYIETIHASSHQIRILIRCSKLFESQALDSDKISEFNNSL